MTDSPQIFAGLINGKATTLISLLDRGFAYGDGVFETVRVDRDVPYLWSYHCQRLISGCQKLNILFKDWTLLEQEVKLLCKNLSNYGCSWGILKIIISRGVGGRSYRPPQNTLPTRVLCLMQGQLPSSECYQEGVNVTICRHRLPYNQQLAGIKHLNRLDQVIARSEWEDEYFEGLMLDNADHVIEGTMSNLFICSGEELLTPQLDECGVSGVMREHLLVEGWKYGFRCRETCLTLDRILSANGALICNSVIGILPIRRVNLATVSLPPMIQQLQEFAAVPK